MGLDVISFIEFGERSFRLYLFQADLADDKPVFVFCDLETEGVMYAQTVCHRGHSSQATGPALCFPAPSRKPAQLTS